MQVKPKITFFIPNLDTPIPISFISEGIKAGFPSPAADFEELKLSLDHLLIKSIDDGDILVIDRSLEPRNNAVAICFIDGEFTVKRIKKENEEVFLMPENPNYKPIKMEPENELVIWGIVTYAIKQMK